VKAILRIVLMCVLSTSLMWALEIKGRISSPEGKPIEKAVVLHRSSGAKTLTDESGAFLLILPDAERINLEIIHSDYMDQVITIAGRNLGKNAVITLIPLVRQKEEIVVTALRYPESSGSIPVAETVLSKERIDEKMPSTIAQGLLELPGIANLGAGGFSLVPSIRGLARRRVLVMIDNARVTSDRRTGPSASFIAPQDIEKIEVLRSPSSVFYGSDAIGGVVRIFTRKADQRKRFQGKISGGYSTVNLEKSMGISFQGSGKHTGFFLSFNGSDADNYSSPSGSVPQSYFTQASLFAKISHITPKRDIEVSFLGARGRDIGKANRDSLAKPTWYPRENQNFLQIHWREKTFSKGDLTFQLFVNPHYMETKKEEIRDHKEEESFSRTQSLDYGLRLAYVRTAKKVRLSTGVDFYGRSGAHARNESQYFDPQGNINKEIKEIPYEKGRRTDLGFFLSADYLGIPSMDLVGGIRWDIIHVRAVPGGSADFQKSRYYACTGFLGASLKLDGGIVLFSSISRAYRAPSLSELFYTGITGRGFIIAQPDLDPEMSLNFDAGIKIYQKRLFAGCYLFSYRIDDLIERYVSQGDIHTYGNIDRGHISGVELEAEYFPLSGWKIFGNVFVFKGRSTETGDPLNDVPSPRLFLGTKLWLKRLSFELNTTLQSKKNDPGPAEIAIPGYGTMNLEASYSFSASLRFFLLLSNLFNRAYLARSDPDSVEEPGRSIKFGFNCIF
jgi:outer membrane receptor protein involved in Fe transport